MTIEQLRSLQSRIRESKGADRELDLAISEAFAQPMAWSGDIVGLGSPPYTSDPDGLGACKALQMGVLPGCSWTRDADGNFAIWRETGTAHDALGWISDVSPLAIRFSPPLSLR